MKKSICFITLTYFFCSRSQGVIEKKDCGTSLGINIGMLQFEVDGQWFGHGQTIRYEQ